MPLQSGANALASGQSALGQVASAFFTRVKNLDVLWLLWAQKESWPAWIFHPTF